MLERRTFLRGLATLPLIGGGVTLIGRPAAPVPLADVAVAPILADPRERARYAWEAFSAAMREITAGSHGWVVIGAAERKPHPGVCGGHSVPGGSFLRVGSVHYTTGEDPRCPRLIVERHREIDLA